MNVCALLSLSVLSAKRRPPTWTMEQLTVNDQVIHRHHRLRTHPLCRYIHRQGGGDQPINNTIRLKPKDNVYADGEVLAIVTIVTERYRTQYALLYTTRMQEAVTDKEIECSERNAYNNPAVSLSTADMTKYARQIWSSSAKYRNVATKMHRMVMRPEQHSTAWANISSSTSPWRTRPTSASTSTRCASNYRTRSRARLPMRR